jgi:hypothetical protein
MLNMSQFVAQAICATCIFDNRYARIPQRWRAGELVFSAFTCLRPDDCSAATNWLVISVLQAINKICLNSTLASRDAAEQRYKSNSAE